MRSIGILFLALLCSLSMNAWGDVKSKKEIAADHPTWCPGCGKAVGDALDVRVHAEYFLQHQYGAAAGSVGSSGSVLK